jgi:hypothetical protein
LVEYEVSDDEQKQFDSPINIIKSSVIENTQDVSNEASLIMFGVDRQDVQKYLKDREQILIQNNNSC